MKRRLIIAAAVLAAFVSQAPAQTVPGHPDPSAVRAGDYALDKSHAKINWSVSHLGFSIYNGEFTDMDARLSLDARNPERSQLSVTVNTNSVETNDDALDAHLRNADFFNVAKFPTMTFRSTRVERTAANRARVTGNLTLLGQTRPVVLDVRFIGAGVHPVTKSYTIGFAAEGSIRRSDFGMKFLAPAVSDEVRLSISGEFNPAGASPR